MNSTVPNYNMTTTLPRLAMLLAAAALGAALATFGHAHAEPQPAFDRALTERLVRAEEAQVHALETLARAVERCK